MNERVLCFMHEPPVDTVSVTLIIKQENLSAERLSLRVEKKFGSFLNCDNISITFFNIVA